MENILNTKAEKLYQENKKEILNLLAEQVSTRKIAFLFKMNASSLAKKLKRDNYETSTYLKILYEDKKKCAYCKNFLPLDNFFNTKKEKRKLSSYCRTCLKDNRKSLTKEEQQNKYLRDKPKIRIRILNNKELEIFRSCKCRAKQKNLDFNITVEDIIIPEYCPILGIKLDEIKSKTQHAPSIDRIDNSKGYIKGNVMIISRKANTMKSNATSEELLIFSEYFINKYKNEFNNSDTE